MKFFSISLYILSIFVGFFYIILAFYWLSELSHMATVVLLHPEEKNPYTFMDYLIAFEAIALGLGTMFPFFVIRNLDLKSMLWKIYIGIISLLFISICLTWKNYAYWMYTFTLFFLVPIMKCYFTYYELHDKKMQRTHP